MGSIVCRMTAQPIDPSTGPDVGTYEVIHLGDEAAVVVPLGDFLRLRALERRASVQDLEDAEDAAALHEWQLRDAAGTTSYLTPAQARHQLDLDQ
jgi:hypothetical protein